MVDKDVEKFGYEILKDILKEIFGCSSFRKLKKKFLKMSLAEQIECREQIEECKVFIKEVFKKAREEVKK